jgi:NADH-quinone oxidoreductase subunit H
MFISSAIMATLFFGGYHIPFLHMDTMNPNLAAVLGGAALFIKTAVFIFIFMWIRWTVPRFRYDQLMRLGWNSLIPLALVNMVVTGAVILLLKK